VNIKFKGFYKSIRNITWDNIPNFAVITGTNGSGKTQLLELIHNSLVSGQSPFSSFEVEGLDCSFDQIVYLKGDWGVTNIQAVDISGIQSSHRGIHMNAFSQYDRPNIQKNTSYKETPQQQQEYDQFTKSLGKSLRYHVTYEEFERKYPKDTIDVRLPINRQINNIFFNYRVAQIESFGNGLNASEFLIKFGSPPWEVLREIIKVSGLPFEINDPSKTGLWDAFELRLTHKVTRSIIPFVDLSSGEKILLSIIFYLYRSQEKGIFPKLLLMDEPDAHLHPSMTQQFLNVVKDILVGKFGIRVIMTTHSPSTVVLAPENSIFEMSITEPRIKPTLSKNHAIALLTSGLVFVGKGSKYFLVEDQVDVDFYSFVNNQLISENKLNTDTPLVFIKASTNANSGGKNVVSSWVEKLRTSGLNSIIHGLIDKDYGNKVGEGLFSINRYSIENYLVDPIVIYCALMDSESAFEVSGRVFGMGEEYRLKAASQELLQEIVEIVCLKMFSVLSEGVSKLSTDKVIIKFNNDLLLEYPKWILETRGKTLLNNICNVVFGSKINFGTLFKSFKRLNLIPNDLTEKFIELQSVTATLDSH